MSNLRKKVVKQYAQSPNWEGIKLGFSDFESPWSYPLHSTTSHMNLILRYGKKTCIFGKSLSSYPFFTLPSVWSGKPFGCSGSLVHYSWVLKPKRVGCLNGPLFHTYQYVLYLLRCLTTNAHMLDIWKNKPESERVSVILPMGLWGDFSLQMPLPSEKHHQHLTVTREFLIG